MRRARAVLPVAVLGLLLSAVPAVADPPPVPVFKDGEAQPVFDPGKVVRESLWVTAPVDSDKDGRDDVVHVEVVRPEATNQGTKLPVVYQASPYFAQTNDDVPNHNVDTELFVPGNPPAADKAGSATGHDERMNIASKKAEIKWEYEQYLLARGYAVVYGESLGTGESTGCPTTGANNETLGAKSVVDWLNARADAHDAQGTKVPAGWSTGKVGMMGVSYNGTLPNAVAATGVKGLEAIVPIGAISDWYDYYRANGAVVAPGGYQGEDADVLAKFVYSRADRQICAAQIEQMTADQDRITGDSNPFWKERTYLKDAGKVHAAVLSVHGLHDWNVKTKQAAQWYAALREHNVPHKIWWHQSGHTDPIQLRKDEWLQTLNRWFTRYLHGVDNGAEREPKATIQREDGKWVTEPEWPAPSRDVRLSPQPGGNQRGGLKEESIADKAASESLRDDATKKAEDLVAAPQSDNRLAYFTDPARDPVRISGTVHAGLALSFDRPAANVTALLVDQAPDGQTSVITRGWIDPQNRDGIGKTEPIEPGEQYQLAVPMQPDDYVLPAGHKLGLAVLSSDHEFTLRPKPGTGLTLNLAQTDLHLPVVKPAP